MTYFLMQLHFWLYTHKHNIMDDYVLPLLFGMAIGFIIFA